ncbi:MAG TPA: HAMP domain-containing sensor histidine kinase [bacterium]|nr:HAMP domain-containing sensor histidine kinase [bacterium]
MDFLQKIGKIKLKDFDKASLKLTLYYVAIVMLISISFSTVVYRISSVEINQGLGRQLKMLRDMQVDRLPSPIASFEQARLEQTEESNRRLRLNLTYFNLLILLLSSGLSYILARKTLEPIEEAMEAQNRFTADASHELRTPLTAMRTEIEVALRDKKLDSTDSRKLLESNLEEIGKLETLSGALLKLARYNEKEDLGFEYVSLAEVLAEAYSKIESLAEEKSIEFETKTDNLDIFGDKQSLVELFVILFDNAIKYSPNNSRVLISGEQREKRTIVKVKDRGAGIKASDLPYIFNRFYRADSSRSKDKINGYGLGLSIAKRIVEMHNGSISAESKPGKGSTFIVELPND